MDLKVRPSAQFVSIPEDVTVSEAIELIRQKKSELGEKFLYVYTVSREGKLEGVLQLRDLLLNDSHVPVKTLAYSKPIFLSQNDSEKTAIQLFRKYPFFALPVVDQAGRLTGTIDAKAFVTDSQFKSHRLLHYFAGMGGEEIEEKSIFKIILRRLPWLVMSMLSGLMCAYILGIFVEEIESMIALVLFIPIVLGVAGGVGVQSSVITLRGLNEGKIELSAIGKVLVKEIAIGLLIGIISCLVISMIALIWQKSPILGIALGVSIVASVVASGILGVMLPLILKALRINPEFASGLFVLVICDIVVMMIYFSLSFAIINPQL